MCFCLKIYDSPMSRFFLFWKCMSSGFYHTKNEAWERNKAIKNIIWIFPPIFGPKMAIIIMIMFPIIFLWCSMALCTYWSFNCVCVIVWLIDRTSCALGLTSGAACPWLGPTASLALPCSVIALNGLQWRKWGKLIRRFLVFVLCFLM